MKIELTPEFVAHLKDNGINVTSPVEINNDVYFAELQRISQHPIHIDEGHQSNTERAVYSILWADKGVPEHTGDPEVGSGVMAARRSVSILDEIREQNREVLPRLSQEIGGAIATASSNANADAVRLSRSIESAIKASSENLVSELSNLRKESEEYSEEIIDHLLTQIYVSNEGLKSVRRAIYQVGGAIAFLLLATLILFSSTAHAQIDVIKLQQDGTTFKTVAAPLTINCSTNVSCSWSSGKWVITATSGGPGGTTTIKVNAVDATTQNPINFQSGTNIAVSNPSAGNIKYDITGTVALANGGTNYASNTGGAGKVLIGNGSGAFVEGDPLVQGLVAAGASVASVNPVYIGGVDGSGNSKGLVLDASGRPTTNINGTVQVQSNSANIATETTLGNIKTGTDRIPAQGQALAAASLPVVLTAAQITTLTPPAAITNFANETGGNLASIKTNTDKIPALGQAAMAASTPVVIASNQTSIPVASTLTAETTKVIGTVRTADGAGNLFTSNSTTYTAKFGQDMNLLGTLGTAFSTAGKVDVKSAAGDLNATLAAETTKVIGTARILGNAGAIVDGPTGSAPPANAVLSGVVGSGATGGLQSYNIKCDGYAFYDASTNGATQVVALTASRTIYVCGYSITSSSTTANTIKLVYGTGSNCATGQTAMTPGYILQAPTGQGPVGKVVPPNTNGAGLKTASANALCVLTNAAAAAQVEVWFAII